MIILSLCRNGFVGYGFDGYLLLNRAMPVPLKMVMPRTLKSCPALRDALENARDAVDTYVMYMMSSFDRNAAWTTAPECCRMSSRSYEL